MLPCERGGLWQQAVGTWKMMERHIAPNVITCSAVISACERGGRWQKAFSILCEMRQRHVVPNAITYSAAISACEQGALWQQVLGVRREAWRQRLDLDAISYNCVISIEPLFSLDPIDNGKTEEGDPDSSMQEKRFEPDWLAGISVREIMF